MQRRNRVAAQQGETKQSEEKCQQNKIWGFTKQKSERITKNMAASVLGDCVLDWYRFNFVNEHNAVGIKFNSVWKQLVLLQFTEKLWPSPCMQPPGGRAPLHYVYKFAAFWVPSHFASCLKMRARSKTYEWFFFPAEPQRTAVILRNLLLLFSTPRTNTSKLQRANQIKRRVSYCPHRSSQWSACFCSLIHNAHFKRKAMRVSSANNLFSNVIASTF